MHLIKKQQQTMAVLCIVLGLIGLVFSINLIQKQKNEDARIKARKERANKIFDELVTQETEKLKKHNREWEKEAGILFGERKRIFALDKKGNEAVVLPMYLEHLEKCQASEKFKNTNNVVVVVNRIIVLYGKLHNKQKQKEFIKIAIDKYADYEKVSEWEARLNKLEQNKGIEDFNIIDTVVEIPKGQTKGERIRELQLEFPEFNWYYDKPEEMETYVYLNLYNKNHKESEAYSEWSSLVLDLKKEKELGTIAESKKDYKNAIIHYKRMVVEESENSYPYERLAIIYRKLKWTSEEIQLLNATISFFSNLTSKQERYVMHLAEKYNMTDKAKEYISSESKIFYYGGVFTLYNSHKTIILKFKKRLKKISSEEITRGKRLFVTVVFFQCVVLLKINIFNQVFIFFF